jgi:membrane fusion protein, multidrug efflux system
MNKKLSGLIGVLIFLAACTNEKKEISTVSDNRIVVRTTIAELSGYTPVKIWAGTLLPGKEANLGATLPGKVEKEYFPEGAMVHKGDLIAELSGELYTQALVEYEAIKKDYERVENLKEKGSVTEQDFDHVKAKLDASKAKVEMLQKNTRIIAPFDGVIVDYLVQEGENYFFSPSLEPGYSMNSGIVKLMQINPLRLSFEVNEKEFHSLKKGQKIFFINDLSTDTLQGTISLIRPALSTITHTGTVEALVPNPCLNLNPGMSATVMIPGTAIKGIRLPSSAMIRHSGSASEYVFEAKNDSACLKKVEQIVSEGDYSFINGIPEGTLVITVGAEKLKDGSPVKILTE